MASSFPLASAVCVSQVSGHDREKVTHNSIHHADLLLLLLQTMDDGVKGLIMALWFFLFQGTLLN